MVKAFCCWRGSKDRLKLPSVLPDAFLRCMSPADRKTVAPGQSTAPEVASRSIIKAEKQLQGLIYNFLRVNDVEVLWHRTDKKSHATVGWPDLTFAVRGKAVAWEVKLPGRKPEQHQSQLHERMVLNGWAVEVIISLEQAIARFGTLTARI